MAPQPNVSTAASTQSPYSTASLDYAKRDIRLVELKRSEASEKIKCVLRSYPVDGPHPPYIALSYAWGDNVRYAEIELNGHSLPVGRNLWHFLSQMRTSKKFHTYWVDAICIDQTNLRERNHQVQMMRQIYSNAESVYAWLGEEDKVAYSNTAMTYLARRDVIKAATVGTKRFWTPRQAHAMLSLCERPYWTRIWIVQELLLAKAVTILCGSKAILWSRFQRLFKDIATIAQFGGGLHNRVFPVLSSAASTIVKTKSEWKEGCLSLVALLTLCRNQRSTDRRDKVYALLGLANDSQGITVDYGTTSEQLLIVVYYHTCINLETSYNLRRSTIYLARTARLLQDVLKAYRHDEFLRAVTIITDHYLEDREKLVKPV